MKILRDTEYTPIGRLDWFEPMQSPVYMFKHKKYGDVVALNEAKFIIVSANIVYYYNAYNGIVSVSKSLKEHSSSETPIPELMASGG